MCDGGVAFFDFVLRANGMAVVFKMDRGEIIKHTELPLCVDMVSRAFVEMKKTNKRR